MDKKQIKRALIWIVLISMFIVGLTCSCLNSKSESESTAVAESTSVAESHSENTSVLNIGNTTTESSNALTSDLSVSGVIVENITESKMQEPEFTFAQLFWNIYQDRFFKIMFIVAVTEVFIVLNVLLMGLLSGNLHPDHKFSFREKKLEKA